MLQQLTGINTIIFYSNTIFNGSSLLPEQVTFLVGAVNFASTIGGLFLLSFFGRRSIVLTCQFLMAIDLILLGWCGETDKSTAEIYLLMLFIILFEFSVGPILWLYMAEICQDKAIGLASCLNWLIGLIISSAIPPVIKAIKTPENDNVGYIFIFYGIITAVGLVFIYFFMYETKGKTQQEI